MTTIRTMTMITGKENYRPRHPWKRVVSSSWVFVLLVLLLVIVQFMNNEIDVVYSFTQPPPPPSHHQSNSIGNYFEQQQQQQQQKDQRRRPVVLFDTTTTQQQQQQENKKQLTERQLQFWEDVDKGLDGIESFYSKRGMSINRVREFAETARGNRPQPVGSLPGHEPSEEHVDGLTARPFWDTTNNPDLFPWAAELERNSHIIQREFEEKLKRDKKAFASDSAWQSQVMGGGWSAIRLQRLGVWNTENCQEFKQTYELLRSLDCPFAVRGVCFARQAPGSGVQPHSDGRNFILTSHLGLQVPDGCWIEVGGERREWEEGKLITLDTSFSHSTLNPTQEDRNVLIIDFWHPELTEAERAALEFVYDLRNKFESGQVPFRKPTSRPVNSSSNDDEGGGLLGSLWKSISGGS